MVCAQIAAKAALQKVRADRALSLPDRRDRLAGYKRGKDEAGVAVLNQQAVGMAFAAVAGCDALEGRFPPFRVSFGFELRCGIERFARIAPVAAPAQADMHPQRRAVAEVALNDLHGRAAPFVQTLVRHGHAMPLEQTSDASTRRFFRLQAALGPEHSCRHTIPLHIKSFRPEGIAFTVIATIGDQSRGHRIFFRPRP